MNVSPLCERLKQYKMTTPPWKETFRKECLERMRQKRRRLIDGNRRINTNDIVEEGWTKLREHYGDDLDSYLAIYDEIKMELDEEVDKIFEEYERSVNFPSGSGVHVNVVDVHSVQNTQLVPIICALCGKRNHYATIDQTLNQSGDLVSFCDCGYLQVDRRTKVLEPTLIWPEACRRLNETAIKHRLICAATPHVHVSDGGINDGNQLMVACQACDMILVIW